MLEHSVEVKLKARSVPEVYKVCELKTLTLWKINFGLKDDYQ